MEFYYEKFLHEKLHYEKSKWAQLQETYYSFKKSEIWEPDVDLNPCALLCEAIENMSECNEIPQFLFEFLVTEIDKIGKSENINTENKWKIAKMLLTLLAGLPTRFKEKT